MDRDPCCCAPVELRRLALQAAAVFYYLLKNPKRVEDQNPYITLIRKNILCFLGILKQVLVFERKSHLHSTTASLHRTRRYNKDPAVTAQKGRRHRKELHLWVQFGFQGSGFRVQGSGCGVESFSA